MKPIVSIVIPTFNRANIINKAIQSAINQTYRPIEIIVIDDGSSDNTEKIVSQFPEVKYFKQKNQGASQARNNGVSKANGEYIAFLDSDDLWVKRKLELQMQLVLKHNLNIIGSRRKYINNLQAIDSFNQHLNLGFHTVSFKKQLKRTWFSPATMVIKKDFFESLGGFDTHQKIAEDWDLWLRIAYQNPIPRMNAILAYCLVLKGGLADNRLEKYLNDLKVIKKWNPENGKQISLRLYKNWASSFSVKRLFKLLHRANKNDAQLFWSEVKTELPISFPAKIIGEILLKIKF